MTNLLVSLVAPFASQRALSRALSKWLALPALLVALLLLLGWSQPAAADEGSSSRFTWHPSISLRAIGDDNVFFADGAGEEDLGFWISPRVEALLSAESYEVGGELGGDFVQFVDHSTLGQEYIHAKGHAEVGLLPGLTLRMSNAYEPQPLLLGRPADQSENLLQINESNATLSYWRALPADFEIELLGSARRLIGNRFGAVLPSAGGAVFDGAVDPDYWQGVGQLSLNRNLGRRSDAFATARYRQRLIDSASDFSDSQLLVGVRSRLIEHVELVLSAGWGMIDARGTSHHALGEASVRHRMPSGWGWHAAVSNRFRADLTGNDFAEAKGELGVEKRFGQHTSASASVFISHLDGSSWQGGDNLFGGVEASLSHRFEIGAGVALTYRHWENDGDVGFDDFDQNRIVLELSYRH